MSLLGLNDTASNVSQFLCFRKIDSPFGFLYLVGVEKDDYEIPKHYCTLNENSRLSTWSQLSDIFCVINKHVADNSDHPNKALEELKSIRTYTPHHVSSFLWHSWKCC